jgi:hypothetical protein
MEVKQLPKVKLDELGMYLRTIYLDYKPTTNKERAELVTQFFNVLCTEEDIEHYEELHYFTTHFVEQDFELESKRESYFQSLGKFNPF